MRLRLARLEHAAIVLDDLVGDLRREQIVVVLADHLVDRQPEGAGPDRVDHQVAPGQVLHEHRARRALDHGVEQAVALDQRPLGLLALRDVADERHGEPPALHAEAAQADFDRERGAVLPAMPGVERQHLPGFEPRPDRVLEVGVDVDLRRAHAHELVARVPEAVARLLVDVEDDAAAPVQEEGVGGVVHEDAEAALARPQLVLGPAELGDVLDSNT